MSISLEIGLPPGMSRRTEDPQMRTKITLSCEQCGNPEHVPIPSPAS